MSNPPPPNKFSWQEVWLAWLILAVSRLEWLFVALVNEWMCSAQCSLPIELLRLLASLWAACWCFRKLNVPHVSASVVRRRCRSLRWTDPSAQGYGAKADVPRWERARTDVSINHMRQPTGGGAGGGRRFPTAHCCGWTPALTGTCWLLLATTRLVLKRHGVTL